MKLCEVVFALPILIALSVLTMASDVFLKSGLRPAKLAQCFLLHSCVDNTGAEFRIVVCRSSRPLSMQRVDDSRIAIK